MALVAKGFEEKDNGKHRKFYLLVDGKRTAVQTMMSHSPKDLRPPIQRKMAKQMSLEHSRFVEFVDCTMSGEAYVELLEGVGIL